MKTYIITSTQWGGSIELDYDTSDTGLLCAVRLLLEEPTMDFIAKVLSNLPLQESGMEAFKNLRLRSGEPAYAIAEQELVPTAEQFYAAYPQTIFRNGPGETKKKWTKMSNADRIRAFDGLKKFIKQGQERRKTMPEYNYPAPEVYLNQQRWNA